MTHEGRVLLTAALTAVFALPAGAAAQVSRRSAGLALRGSAWSRPAGAPHLVWRGDDEHTLFDGDGLGGWISFLARASPHVLVELSLGTVVRTVEKVQHADGTDTYVEALVPLLAGVRFHPFAPRREGALVPYLAVGGGPYWTGDIVKIDSGRREDVSVDGRHRFGGYLGGGVDFMITDWVGLNFDVRRHYVDFRADHESSGLEYGAGIVFLWGHRRGGRR